MIYRHHDLQIELDDAWWQEAGMIEFVPMNNAYRAGSDPFKRRIQTVTIADIGPVRRSPGVGLFNDDREMGLSAKDRVIRILQGIRLNHPIPPVEVVIGQPAYNYPYKLVAGVHRLYCSLAVGFTLIPCVEGFDITA